MRAVIRRMLATACCLAVVGCAAGPVPVESTPGTTTSIAVSVPADGVLLRSLGYRNAPEGFSVPADSRITERVDQENTVVAVFTAPGGLEIAHYLRETLPGQGWSITADDKSSLLFERGQQRGAFTVNGAFAGLSLRWDPQS